MFGSTKKSIFARYDAPRSNYMSYMQNLAQQFYGSCPKNEVEEVCYEPSPYCEVKDTVTVDHLFKTIENSVPQDIPIVPGDDFLTDAMLNDMAYVNYKGDEVVVSGNGEYLMEALVPLDQATECVVANLDNETVLMEHDFVKSGKPGQGTGHYVVGREGCLSTNAHIGNNEVDVAKWACITPDTSPRGVCDYKYIVNGLGYKAAPIGYASTIFLSFEGDKMVTTWGKFGYASKIILDEIRTLHRGDIVLVSLSEAQALCIIRGVNNPWSRVVDQKLPTKVAMSLFLSKIREQKHSHTYKISLYDKNNTLNGGPLELSFPCTKIAKDINSFSRGEGCHILDLFPKCNSLLVLTLRMLGFYIYRNRLYNSALTVDNSRHVGYAYSYFARFVYTHRKGPDFAQSVIFDIPGDFQ